MTRHLRLVALGLVAFFGAGTHPAASASKTAEKHARDLAPATPESVGMSTERLSRLDAAMKKLVDDKQVAGLVTLVERHGKIVDFNAVGQLDVRKPDADAEGLDLPHLFDVEADHRRGDDDVVRRGKVADQRSRVALHSGVRAT